VRSHALLPRGIRKGCDLRHEVVQVFIVGVDDPGTGERGARRVVTALDGRAQVGRARQLHIDVRARIVETVSGCPREPACVGLLGETLLGDHQVDVDIGALALRPPGERADEDDGEHLWVVAHLVDVCGERSVVVLHVGPSGGRHSQ
jgi:hypothetical protein